MSNTTSLSNVQRPFCEASMSMTNSTRASCAPTFNWCLPFTNMKLSIT